MKIYILALSFILLTACQSQTNPQYYGFTQNKRLEINPNLTAHEYQHKNGLIVVLIPNKKAPLTNIYHWVKAGSLHETPGTTGIAHLFEHMMFRPLSPKDIPFDDKARKLGALTNANTRFGSTVYTTTVPNENANKMLKLESDRFKNLVVSDDLLNIERKAVWSECSTKFDVNPIMDLWFTIYQAAFPGHPYGWTIIGFREDLNKIKASDCNKFFKKFYSPNNTGLFIAGDINIQKTLSAIEKYYGDWTPTQNSVLPNPFIAPDKSIFQRGKLKSTSTDIILGYRIPEYDQKNYHLLNITNHIFFGSSNSLAKRRLLHDKKLVSDIGPFGFNYDMGMIKCFAAILPGKNMDQVVTEIQALNQDFDNLTRQEFKAYQKEYQIGITESFLKNENIVQNLSLSWGKWGNIKYIIKEKNAKSKVSRKQITKFITQYFQPGNMTVVTYK